MKEWVVLGVRRADTVRAPPQTKLTIPFSFDASAAFLLPREDATVTETTAQAFLESAEVRDLLLNFGLGKTFEAQIEPSQITITCEETPETQHVIEAIQLVLDKTARMVSQNVFAEKYNENERLLEFARWYNALSPEELAEARPQLVQELRENLK